jgi:hypothetical protein
MQAEKVEIAHEDNRRSIKCIFNGDFVAKQAIIIEVKEGEKITIPSRTYHEVFLPKGTIMIGFTEKEYIGPEVNDIPYKDK